MPANLTPNLGNAGISWNQTPFLTFSKGYSSISANRLRKSLVVEAKKKKKDSEDAHNFFPKPDEATGVFPEAVLLKEVTPTSPYPSFFFFFFFPFLFLPATSYMGVFRSLRLCFLSSSVNFVLSATVFHDFVV